MAKRETERHRDTERTLEFVSLELFSYTCKSFSMSHYPKPLDFFSFPARNPAGDQSPPGEIISGAQFRHGLPKKLMKE